MMFCRISSRQPSKVSEETQFILHVTPVQPAKVESWTRKAFLLCFAKILQDIFILQVILFQPGKKKPFLKNFVWIQGLEISEKKTSWQPIH